MRVTKLIREYVEKRVQEAYPKSEAELIWEEKRKRMDDTLTKANDIVVAYAKKVAEELNAEFGLDDYRLEVYNRAVYHSYFTTTYYADCAEYKACQKAEAKRIKKIKETIEEILITLELGGTKAELEEMLAKVGKGE